jgi:hypothetical protein
MNKDGVLNGIPVTPADFSSAGATVRTSPYLTAPVPVTVESAADAYTSVMNKAGASLHRLTMDNRLIGQLKSLGKQGTNIADESAVGGVGTVKGGTPLMDSDQDGMPDTWEKAKGLNPNSAADRNATNLSSDGYTNLEVYLNELAGDNGSTAARDNERPAFVGVDVNKTAGARINGRSLVVISSTAMNVHLDFLNASGRALCRSREMRVALGETALLLDKRLSGGIVLVRMRGENGLDKIVKCKGE